MLHVAACAPFVPHPRRRDIFLTRTTQHVTGVELLRELLRALAALGGIAAWGALLILLAP
ncbi:MAG: hypothetical protein HY728_01170 [Candidatus Rokubacteria bacterium]|nr:hypothetical protein [Candidatus Rokubacteria bacterium]MBI4592802.1 hypothetical protein [Candidatus Rokubacteria bacterium]